MTFLLSSIYLTRACPMHCEYCRIRTPIKNELSLKEWKEVFTILNNMKIPFNLILGNEPLMLQDDLVELIQYFTDNNIDYGMYTTFPEPFFTKYKYKLLTAGLKNLSCGIDIPTPTNDSDIHTKSVRGLEGLKWAKKVGVPNLHATVTMSKLNLSFVPEIVDYLTKLGVWTEVNIIHYAKDEGYDFFPPVNEMKDLVLTKDNYPLLLRIAGIMKEKVLKGEVMLHNVPEYFDDLVRYGLSLEWHCNRPVVLAIDSDGSLRVCSYRKGKSVSKYSIFDLPQREEEFLWDWKNDSKQCPGCFWSCWWHAEYYYLRKNVELGKKYFQTHESEFWRKNY